MYIIDGLRTPIGRRGKSLRDISAVKLGSVAIKAILEKNGLEGSCIDEVIFGNTVGAGLGQNPARQALVGAGVPSSVPGYTINMVCGSGLKSVILAARAIACKDAEIVLAGGTESASQCPDILVKDGAKKTPEDKGVQSTLISDGLWCDLAGAHMGTIAEYTAEHFKISKSEQDEYSYRSYSKACAARDKGLFKNEIVQVEIAEGRSFDTDERPKAISIDELSRAKPAFKPDGSVTAGNSPAPADGAAALIIASEKAVAKYGIRPLARILGYSSVAVEPKLTFTAPALAVKKCLTKSGLKMADVDLFEINEAFAVQAILTIRELEPDPKRVNIFGGTIALGHPLGASGARGLVTLLNSMKTEGKKTGVTCICLGGGCSLAVAVQMLNGA